MIYNDFSIPLQPSRQLACLFVLIYGLAVCCTLCSAAPTPLKICISLFAAYYLQKTLGNVLLKTKNAALAISLKSNKEWQLQCKNDQHYVMTIQENSLVTRFLMILNFQATLSSQKRTLFITPKNIDKEQYRQLYVYLRM